MTNPVIVAPEGGRLCRRDLRDGSALVGVLHLPSSFVPVEGASYALQESPQGLRLDTTIVREAPPIEMQAYGVGDLLTQQIWNKTKSPDVMTVRFISALPETNVWTVYGASHHPSPEDQCVHAWFDIDQDGRMKTIPAPCDAMGEGIGSLLTSHPVWPDREGTLHTVPQIHTAWRPHYLAYHQLLVEAARNPDVDSTLEAKIARNPKFRELSIGRVEREYCRYLSILEERGLMVMDGPKTADAYAEHMRATREIISELMGDRVPRRSSPSP